MATTIKRAFKKHYNNTKKTYELVYVKPPEYVEEYIIEYTGIYAHVRLLALQWGKAEKNILMDIREKEKK